VIAAGVATAATVTLISVLGPVRSALLSGASPPENLADIGTRALWHFAAVALLWQRGIRLGSEPMDSDVALERVKTAATAMAGLAVIVSLRRGPVFPAVAGSLGAYILGGCFLALLFLTVVRLEEVLGESSGPVARRRWLRTFSLLGGATVVAAAAFTALVSPEGLGQVLGLLRPVAWGLRWLAGVLGTLAGIAAYYIYLLVSRVVRLHPRWPELPAIDGMGPGPQDAAEDLAAWAFGPLLIRIITVLLLAGGLLLVILLLRRAFSWYRFTSDSGSLAEVRESVWSWGRARDGLRRRLFRRRRPPPAGPWLADEERLRRLVRLTYCRLLIGAGRVGRGRPPSCTPAEFNRVLDDLWQRPADTRRLTDLYQQVRYGDASPREDEAARAVTTADELEAGLRPDAGATRGIRRTGRDRKRPFGDKRRPPRIG